MLGLGLSLQRLRAVGDFFSFLFRRIREEGGTVEAQKCATEEAKYVKKSTEADPTIGMIPSGYKGEADEGNSGGYLGKLYSLFPKETLVDVLNIQNPPSQVTWDGSVITSGGAGDTYYINLTASYDAFRNTTYNLTVTAELGTSTVQIYGTGNTGLTLQEGTHTYTFAHDGQNNSLIRFRVAPDNGITLSNISLIEVRNGDFAFSRGSDATRVNSQGYIESVQVIGDNVVQNGDFEEVGSERLNYTTFSLESDNLVSDPTISPVVATQTREFAPPIEGLQQEKFGPVHIDYGGGAGANLITNHDFSTGFVTTPGTGWEDPASEHSITNGVLTLNNNTSSSFSTPVNPLVQNISSLQKSTSYYIEMDIDSFQFSSGARLIAEIGEQKETIILDASVSYSLTPAISTGFIRSVLVKTQLDFNNNQHIRLWIVSSNASDYIDFNSIELKIAEGDTFENLKPDVFSLVANDQTNYGGYWLMTFTNEQAISNYTTSSNNTIAKFSNVGYDRNQPLKLKNTVFISNLTGSIPEPISITFRGENNAWSTTKTFNYGSTYNAVFPDVSVSDLQSTTSTNIYVELNTDVPTTTTFRIFNNLTSIANGQITAVNSQVIYEQYTSYNYLTNNQNKHIIKNQDFDTFLVPPAEIPFNGKTKWNPSFTSTNNPDYDDGFRANTLYQVNLNVSSYTAGSFTFGFENGASDIESAPMSANGDYTFYLATGSHDYGTNANVPHFYKGNGFFGDIKFVSAFEVTVPDWQQLPNCNLDFIEGGGISVNNTSGSDQVLDSGNFDIEAYENYQIEIDVANITAGSLQVSLDETGGQDITNITSSSPDGIYTAIREPNFTGQRSVFVTFSNGFVGDVKSISVRKTNLDGVNANYNVDISQDVYIENNRLVYKYRPGLSQYMFLGLGNGDITGPQYEVNKSYKVEIQGEGNVTFRPAASGPNAGNVALTLPATHYFKWDAADSNHRYQIGRSGTDPIAIDSISLKEVDPNDYWSLGDGWSIIDDGGNFKVEGNNPSGILNTGNILSANKKYRLSFDVNLVSGTLRWKNNITAFEGTTNQVGFQSLSFDYDSGTQPSNLQFSNNGNFTGTIDNISLTEVTDDTDIPRLDYTNQACPSFLLEPQRQNLITYSEDLTQTGWTTNGVSRTNDTTVTNPTGGLGATKASGNNMNGYHNVKFNFSATGSTVTHSVFVKADNLSHFEFIETYGGSPYSIAQYDLQNVNATITSGTLFSNARIEVFPNGWYRCSVVASAYNQLHFNISDGSTTTGITTVGSDESIYMWGAQTEAGSYPTSYIPTNGSTVTRNRDICLDAGNKNIINASEGTLYAEFRVPKDFDGLGFLRLASVDNREVVEYYYQASNVFIREKRDNVWGGQNQLGGRFVWKKGEYFKLAVTYSDTGVRKIYFNGFEIASETNGYDFTNFPFDKIDFDGGSGCGNFRSVLYFDEALTDAQLSALTSSDIDRVLKNYNRRSELLGATYESSHVETKLNELF